MSYRITRRAERDLKDIDRFTAEAFGPKQAERYLQELGAVFELIGAHPQMGRMYEGRTYHFVHGRHIVLYRTAADGIVIGRIFNGAMAQPRRPDELE